MMMPKVSALLLFSLLLLPSLSEANTTVVSKSLRVTDSKTIIQKSFSSKLDQLNKQLALSELKRKEMELRSEVRNAYIELFVLQKSLATLDELMINRRSALKPDSSWQEQMALYKDENEVDNLVFKAKQAQYRLNKLLQAPLTLEQTLENPIKITTLPDREILTRQAIQHWLALEDLIQKQKRLLEQKPSEEQRLTQNIPHLQIVTPLNPGAVLDKAALQNEISLDVASAYEKYLSFGKILARDQESLLPLAEQALRHDPPILSFKEYIDIQLKYLQAALTYQEAISDLEMLVGSPLQ